VVVKRGERRQETGVTEFKTLLPRIKTCEEGIGKFVCESQPEIKDGSDAVERTDTRSESRSEAGD
jgi:hypothetical protein